MTTEEMWKDAYRHACNMCPPSFDNAARIIMTVGVMLVNVVDQRLAELVAVVDKKK